MNPPPICENCKRVVDRTARVGILRDGQLEHERDLCSACRVHVVDCFVQQAPWLEPARVSRYSARTG